MEVVCSWCGGDYVVWGDGWYDFGGDGVGWCKGGLGEGGVVWVFCEIDGFSLGN